MTAIPIRDANSWQDFAVLMARVRAGDAAAMHELVADYGPYLLRAVRMRLHRQMRPKFDSTDFVQDVWASFFADLPRDRPFNLPEELIAFLTRVAQNKVADAARQRLLGQKYNVNRERSLDDSRVGPPPELAARQPTPSTVAMNREEWDRLLQRQPAVYRRILILLSEGKSQSQVAQELNISEKMVSRLIRQLRKQSNQDSNP